MTQFVDDEEAENSLEEARLVQVVLGMPLEQYHRYKSNVVRGLQLFGGSFGSALGEALFYADLKNSVKILNAFQKECVEHDLLFRIYEARQRGITQNV